MLYERPTKLDKDLKGARWQSSTVTTLEDELAQLRRMVDEHKMSESAESAKPGKEGAIMVDTCVEQLSADTVAAGVALAQETNEDDDPWFDPDTGRTSVRSDLSNNAESAEQSSAPQRSPTRKDKESQKTRRRKKDEE